MIHGRPPSDLQAEGRVPHRQAVIPSRVVDYVPLGRGDMAGAAWSGPAIGEGPQGGGDAVEHDSAMAAPGVNQAPFAEQNHGAVGSADRDVVRLRKLLPARQERSRGQLPLRIWERRSAAATS